MQNQKPKQNRFLSKVYGNIITQSGCVHSRNDSRHVLNDTNDFETRTKRNGAPPPRSLAHHCNARGEKADVPVFIWGVDYNFNN